MTFGEVEKMAVSHHRTEQFNGALAQMTVAFWTRDMKHETYHTTKKNRAERQRQ
jgi:hypothetical protein